jgi:hypothetical protein
MELETPDAAVADRTAQVSWAEIQIPNAPRKAVVSWAEIEIPNAPRKAIVSWAELEIPNAGQLDQVAFRGYGTGAPASSTALAAENVNFTVDDHEVFQLRFGVEETNSGNVAAFIPELWAKKNAGSYERLSDQTMVRAWLDAAWADDVATTDRLTTPAGTFTAGRADEVDCITSAVTINASQNTEMVYSLLIKRDAGVTNDTWTFELRYAGGGALEAYTRRPVVTLNRRAAELGYIEVKLSTATGTNTTRTAGMASIAANVANDLVGEDFEFRMHAELSTWQPPSGETRIWLFDYWKTFEDDIAAAVLTSEFAAAGDLEFRVSEAGTAQDVRQTPPAGGTDAQEAQHRLTFEGNLDATNHRAETFKRTASIDPATLGNGGAWGAAVNSTDTTPTIATIHEPAAPIWVFGNRTGGGQGGGYVGSKFKRLMVWEGFAATGALVVDVPYFDRKYTAPEDTGDDRLWVNQGRAPGVITIVGTHVTGYDWVAETTNRTAQVSWAEIELPDAPRKAVVSWAELEIPDVPRSAIVSWAELELPNAPRTAVVSWAEFETPDPPRTAQLSWAELEVPDAPRSAIVSWAELELPNAARKAVVSWAELEIPTAPRSAIVSWAELEIPTAPRTALVSWAELEIPDTIRTAQVSWAELEIPNAPRKAIVSWAELELPDAPRTAQLSWAELELPDGARSAIVSWAELELPNAPRTAIVSWAELEIPTAPRQAIVSWAELEIPDADRSAIVSWAEFELPNAPRIAVVSWAELEIPDGAAGGRSAQVSWVLLQIPGNEFEAMATPLNYTPLRWTVFQETSETKQEHMKIFPPSLESETGVVASEWVDLWLQDSVTVHIWGMVAGDVVVLEGSNAQFPSSANLVQIQPGDITEDNIYKVVKTPRWLRVNKTANAGAGSVNAIILTHA